MKTKNVLLFVIAFIIMLGAAMYASSLNYFFVNPKARNNTSGSPAPATNTADNTPAPSTQNSGNRNEDTPAPTPVVKENITISFTGDVLLDRGVKRYLKDRGYDFVIPKEVRDHLSSADITMINLENPISNRGEPMPDKEWVFRADPEHFSLLTEMGVDIANVANNHILDYGQDAFLDTLDLLEKNNIHYVGGGRNIKEAYSPKIIEVDGLKIAFLGANRVMPTMDWYATETRPGLAATYNPGRLITEIKAVRDKADLVIVMAHWGVERVAKPEGYQRDLAKQYIDAGADAVIASHPHIMQGFEFYKNKPIAYSLGNFIFTDAQKDTAILKLHINKNKKEINPQIVPCEIKSLRTLLMDPSKHKSYFEYLESISFDVSIDDQGYIKQNQQ